MRIARMTLILALAAWLAGCGGKPRYESPEKSQVQAGRDQAECDWEASKATGNVPSSGERQERIKELIDKCMKAKGYAVN